MGCMRRYETSMSRVRFDNLALSLDGYGAGPNQGMDNPLGVGGEEQRRTSC
jgi:hypothetical protein